MTTSNGSALERAGFATEWVFRLMSFALCSAGLLLFGLNLSDAIAQAATLPIGWIIFSIAATLIPPLAALPLVRSGSPRILRRIWGWGAVALLVAYLTAPLGIAGQRFPEHVGLPWIVSLAVVAGCSTTLAWRLRYVILYGIVLEVAIFFLVTRVDGPLLSGSFGDAVEQLFIVALFMFLAVALARAGRTLDATVESAVTEAELASAAELRRVKRQRVEMLIHDSVIVALFSYTNAGDHRKPVAEAKRALAAIRQARGTAKPGADRTPRELAWELQSLATALDPTTEFDYRVTSAGTVPAGAANAIVEASSEALRNSIRHAPSSRPTTRQVRVDISASEIEVLVLDDGDGFDTARVNPSRMGVRSGIVGRLRGVPGGSATVSSKAGYGTTVAIRWRQP